MNERGRVAIRIQRVQWCPKLKRNVTVTRSRSISVYDSTVGEVFKVIERAFPPREPQEKQGKTKNARGVGF